MKLCPKCKTATIVTTRRYHEEGDYVEHVYKCTACGFYFPFNLREPNYVIPDNDGDGAMYTPVLEDDPIDNYAGIAPEVGGDYD